MRNNPPPVEQLEDSPLLPEDSPPLFPVLVFPVLVVPVLVFPVLVVPVLPVLVALIQNEGESRNTSHLDNSDRNEETLRNGGDDLKVYGGLKQ